MKNRRFIPLNASDFAAYLRDSMRAHRRWQHRETERLAKEVFDEVVAELAAHTIAAEERPGVLLFPESPVKREQRRAQS